MRSIELYSSIVKSIGHDLSQDIDSYRCERQEGHKSNNNTNKPLEAI